MDLDDSHHQCRSDLNYITEMFSQNSNNQESSCKVSNEMDSPGDSVDKDDESGVLHFKGHFENLICHSFLTICHILTTLAYN
jgi:hypothetical protein